MWTNYLKLGSILLVIMCTACHGITEYIVKGDWIYVNETPYQIEVQGKFENIVMSAYGRDSIQIQAGEGPKNVEPQNYVSPFEGNCNITVNDTLQVATHILSDVDNYQAVKIKNNHFRFTYTFTNEIIEELLKSKQEQE